MRHYEETLPGCTELFARLALVALITIGFFFVIASRWPQ